MFFPLTKRSLYRITVPILIATLFFSCQKEISIENGGVAVTSADLSTKVSSSVSGFVTDENDAPVIGATVQVGTNRSSTDKYGYFEAKNISVVKNAAFVTVSKHGYFKGIKTWMATDGKGVFFRIKLIPKTNVGNINAAAGGNVTLSNGLSISLPAGAVVNAATNAAYTGAVNVAAYWIDPVSSELNKIMPGDLRGVSAEGSLKLLRSYGMAAVELTGASGELLQVASGKTATLKVYIPATLLASAPATIPLWYFDESNGLWKEQGSAVKTGSTYVGQVSHFSFWNYDTPADYVGLGFDVYDQSGNPVLFAWVKITVVGTNNIAYGWTNLSGQVFGSVPGNSQLQIDIYPSYMCGGTIAYSQIITTTNVDVSLGIITLPLGPTQARVTGTLVDCNNGVVQNGFLMMQVNNEYYRYPINYGSIDFWVYLCGSNWNVIMVGVDNATNQQGIPLNYTLSPGPNPIGNIQACGTSAAEFINYTINGGPPTNLAPPDTLRQSNIGGNVVSVFGQRASVSNYNGISFTFDNTGIAVGSSQNLMNVYINPSPYYTTIPNPINVNITEYGAIGQFISGNFSGTLVDYFPPYITYNIVCSFRIRRNF